jgi:hypothetical protein
LGIGVIKVVEQLLGAHRVLGGQLALVEEAADIGITAGVHVDTESGDGLLLGQKHAIVGQLGVALAVFGYQRRGWRWGGVGVLLGDLGLGRHGQRGHDRPFGQERRIGVADVAGGLLLSRGTRGLVARDRGDLTLVLAPERGGQLPRR